MQTLTSMSLRNAPTIYVSVNSITLSDELLSIYIVQQNKPHQLLGFNYSIGINKLFCLFEFIGGLECFVYSYPL